MHDFKLTVAQNITNLRTAKGITQAELGERLNYSDKSVSKWERGASLPDAYVLKQMSEIFGVTVDYLLTKHDGAAPLPIEAIHKYSRKVIVLITFFSIWAAALLLFVIFWTLSVILWQIFALALPVSILVVMILNAIWGKKLGNFLLISSLIWSVILAIFLCFLPLCLWQIFLLGVPAQIIVILAFNIKKRRKSA